MPRFALREEHRASDLSKSRHGRPHHAGRESSAVMNTKMKLLLPAYCGQEGVSLFLSSKGAIGRNFACR